MHRLYHFPTSPFSARVRLAIALKGVPVEIVDCRADELRLAEARALSPAATIPVFVTGRGDVLGDSGSIVRWLDTACPEPRLYSSEPSELARTLRACDLVDAALDPVVEVGTRAYVLHDAPGWRAYADSRVARVRASLDALVVETAALDRSTFGTAGLNAADIWTFTMVRWFMNLPARVGLSPLAAQILTLGVEVPAALVQFVASLDDKVSAAAGVLG